MSIRIPRAPYILAHLGDTAGCGFHRILRPIELMSNKGVCRGRVETQYVQDHVLEAIKPDIIVWQRQEDVETIARYRRALPDAFFVYEIDDALSAVPDKSWHKAYMPSNVDSKTTRAIAMCDAVTVTTDDLAKRIKEICGNPELDVRVVANMLGADDLLNVEAVKKHAPKVAKLKPRIGWGGGIGHAGDMALLNKAFVELKDEVEWVFIGMNPEMPEGTSCKFAGATAPQEYLKSLAALDLDLMIAPLEENLFNNCKSNLRLVEAGACSYPVIASPVGPYKTGNPPVWAYADTPEAWIEAIRGFFSKSLKERNWAGEKMRRWVESNYILDNQVEERLEGWLPKNVRPFVPKVRKESGFGKPVLVYTGLHLPTDISDTWQVFDNLKDAIDINGTSDIIYMREGAMPTKSLLERLIAVPHQNVGTQSNAFNKTAVCTISVLSNDGGFFGFPKANTFTPMISETAQGIDQQAALDPKQFILPAACGPIVLITRDALNVAGLPDTDTPADVAVIEWSVRASTYSFKNIGFTGAYTSVETPMQIDQVAANKYSMRMALRFPQQQVEDVGLAQFRQDLEIRFCREAFTFLQPQRQDDYAAWASLIDTPGPRAIAQMQDWLMMQPNAQLRLVQYDPYGTVEDLLRTTEDAIDLEWAMFIQHNAIMSPEALAIFVAAIQENPEATIIYADHDYIDDKGHRAGHDFKPNFDLHLLLGRDYVTPVCAVRVGKDRPLSTLFPGDSTLVGDALYAAVFGSVINPGKQSIAHVPYVLAHLQLPPNKELAELTQHKVKTATAFMATYFGNDGSTVTPHPVGLGMMTVNYRGPAHQVSIIIPTKNKVEMLEPCINTILTMTKYAGEFEILVMDNGSDRPEMVTYLESLAFSDPRITVHSWPHAYNWSKLNNDAVKLAEGSVYVFLNDDTRVLSPHWLTEMVSLATMKDVGAAGAKLLYPHNALQHIGVVAHMGINGHTHKGIGANQIGYQGLAILSHEAAAVTGACLAVSKNIFNQVDGFDESLAHNFNDVVFCQELRRRGYVNVVAMEAQLQHLEGATRITAMTLEGRKLLAEEGARIGARYPEPDPYWSPNLRLTSVQNGIMTAGLNYDLLNWERLKRPWLNNRKPHRVLLVGEGHHAIDEKRDGDIVYEMVVTGEQVALANPALENVRPLTLREPAYAKDIFSRLGFDEILVTSIEKLQPSVLQFLLRLDIPITYRPIDAEALCPQRKLQVGGKACDKGWRTRACQTCVDKNNSAHGYVTHVSWMSDWARFIFNENVKVDLDNLESQEYGEAFNEVFFATTNEQSISQEDSHAAA